LFALNSADFFVPFVVVRRIRAVIDGTLQPAEDETGRTHAHADGNDDNDNDDSAGPVGKGAGHGCERD
jgi:hypothetical protein